MKLVEGRACSTGSLYGAGGTRTGRCCLKQQAPLGQVLGNHGTSGWGRWPVYAPGLVWGLSHGHRVDGDLRGHPVRCGPPFSGGPRRHRLPLTLLPGRRVCGFLYMCALSVWTCCKCCKRNSALLRLNKLLFTEGQETDPQCSGEKLFWKVNFQLGKAAPALCLHFQGRVLPGD